MLSYQVTGSVSVPSKIATALDIEATSDKETFPVPAVVESSVDETSTLSYSFWGSISQTYTLSVIGAPDIVFDPPHRQVTQSSLI